MMLMDGKLYDWSTMFAKMAINTSSRPKTESTQKSPAESNPTATVPRDCVRPGSTSTSVTMANCTAWITSQTPTVSYRRAITSPRFHRRSRSCWPIWQVSPNERSRAFKTLPIRTTVRPQSNLITLWYGSIHRTFFSKSLSFSSLRI
uniref:(northern house mosquito) hypothetical protein n=1 Tax=Culex pipiens TaxID=7175 RepID=A0A8D7ZZV2_CULPI